MGRGDLATLVRICDLAGRPRGTGFVADDRGTVVTSHEAVDGLGRVVLHAPGDRTCLAEADAITAAAGGRPGAGAHRRARACGRCRSATRERVEPGTYVRIAARGWREARVLGAAQVTYTATDRFHLVGDALELAIGTDGQRCAAARAARPPGARCSTPRPARCSPSSAPRCSPDTGRPASRCRCGPRAAGRTGRSPNCCGATPRPSPGTGTTSTSPACWSSPRPPSARPDGPGARPEPVERPDTVREFAAFTAALAGPRPRRRTRHGPYDRTRRARRPPRPRRGARPHRVAARRRSARRRHLGRRRRRARARAGRTASSPPRARAATWNSSPPSGWRGSPREAGRPLLVAARRARGDAARAGPPAGRLDRGHGELAERVRGAAGRRLPARALGAGRGPVSAGRTAPARTARAPAAARAPARSTSAAGEAERARERYGHPGRGDRRRGRRGIRSRCGCSPRCGRRCPARCRGSPGREDVFTAHLDLLCLRIAVRIAAASRPRSRGYRRAPAGGEGGRPGPRGGPALPRSRAGGAGPRVLRGDLPVAARAGPPRSSPRACWSRRGRATASPTRSSRTGSRARTWTSMRRSTPWSTAGMRGGRWSRGSGNPARCRSRGTASVRGPGPAAAGPGARPGGTGAQAAGTGRRRSTVWTGARRSGLEGADGESGAPARRRPVVGRPLLGQTLLRVPDAGRVSRRCCGSSPSGSPGVPYAPEGPDTSAGSASSGPGSGSGCG